MSAPIYLDGPHIPKRMRRLRKAAQLVLVWLCVCGTATAAAAAIVAFMPDLAAWALAITLR